MCDGDLFKLLFIKYKSFLRPVKTPENTLKSRIQHARTLPHKNSSFGNSLLRFLLFFSLNSFLPWFCYCVIQKIHFAAFYKLIYAKLFIFFCIFSFCCCATATDAEYFFFAILWGFYYTFFNVARCLFFSLIQKVEMWQEPKRPRGVKKREPKRKVFSSAQYGGKLRTFARIAYTLTQMSNCVCTLQYVPN